MDSNIAIRNETSADVDAITEVTVAAFKTLEISNNTGNYSGSTTMALPLTKRSLPPPTDATEKTLICRWTRIR